MIVLLALKAALAGPLGWEEVRRDVVSNMPEILAAREKILAAQEALRSQEGSFDHKLKFDARQPTDSPRSNRFWEAKVERELPFSGIEVFAGQRQGAGTYATYEGKSATSAVGEVFAGFEIPLLRDRAMDGLRLDREVARIGVGLARHERDQKELEVLLKSGSAYWKWVVTGQKLRIVEAWLAKAEERQRWLERKWKAGDVGAIKVRDNNRSLSKRRSELVKARREHEVARAELALYAPSLSLSPDRLPTDFPSLPAPGPAKSTAGLERFPAIRIIDAQLEALSRESDFARVQLLPRLNLGLEGARDLDGPPPGKTEEAQLRVAIKFELPLENRKAEGKSGELAHKKAALGLRREWLQREWRTRVEQNAQTASTLDEQLEWLIKELEDTAAMARAEERRLLMGAGDVFFVNVREQDEAEANLRLLETRGLRALASLERQFLDGTLIVSWKNVP